MCSLAWRAYFCPGHGSSEAILAMAACASVKMVTVPSVCLLVAATWRALARAAHSATYASWPQPMWVLCPFKVSPFFQVTA